MRWERLGAQSSRWTTGLGDRLLAVGLVVLTLVHFLLSAHFPLAEDELYYWSWSRDLQWSYFDHPPMVAYLIRLSTAIFGNGPFGIRFFACIASTLVVWLVSTLMPSRSMLVALIFTPVVALLSLYMTPDVPLLVFWSLYAIWAATVNRRLQEWGNDPVQRVYHQSPIPAALWILGGLVLGLGMLSKYTMALAPLCFLLLCVLNYRWRAWLSGMILHGLVAFLVATPILIYNLQTGFAPLGFQWGHSLGASHPPAFWNYLLGQVLLVGALPFVMLPWLAIFHPRFTTLPSLQVAFYLFAPPCLFFLVQAARAPMEGNWGLVAYVTFWPLAQLFLDENSFKGIWRAVIAITMAPAFVATAGLLLHSFVPLGIVPIEKDRLYALEAKETAARNLAAELKKIFPDKAVYAPTYQWASYLRYVGLHVRPLPIGRLNHFRMRDNSDPCREPDALVLVEDGNVDASLSCFPNREEVAYAPVQVRGKTTNKLTIQHFTRPGP